MKRYFNFIILIVGLSCVMSYDFSQNETKHDEINDERTQNSAANHLTVYTEMETNRTMTDVLGQDGELSQGRTFGIKRLQFMLLPVMYKAGVMTTLLVILVVLSLKSVMIGLVLLMIKVSGFLAKFHHSHHETPWYPPPHSWPEPHQPQPPIHVHLYNADSHHHPHDPHSDFDHFNRRVQEHDYSKLDYIPSSDPYQNAVTMDRRGQYVFRNP